MYATLHAYRCEYAAVTVTAGSLRAIYGETQEGRLYGLPSCVYISIRIVRNTIEAVLYWLSLTDYFN